MVTDQHLDIALVIAQLGALHSAPPSFPRWMQMGATFATILWSIAHHSENNFSRTIRGLIMLIARNPVNNTFVNAFDYKQMLPQERPDGLLCPGVNFVGIPCLAPVTPAAMSSKHKHPYFRVGRIDNHIDGCTEGATRIDPPDTAIITDDHKGQEAPRGPDRLVHITLRRPKSAAARTVQESTRTVDQPLAYHRSPATTTGDRPLTFQCGIRKAVLDYARGIINDDDTVKLGDLKGPASRFIFSADRLINAPFKGHAIINLRPYSEPQRRKRTEHTFHQAVSVKRRPHQSDDHDQPGPLCTAAHTHRTGKARAIGMDGHRMWHDHRPQREKTIPRPP